MSSPVAVASRASSCFLQPGAVSVRSAAVGGEEKSSRVRVFLGSHLSPPFLDGGDREDRRVVVDADRDPGAVVGDVVHAVGDGFTLGLVGEVVGGHLLGLARGPPLPPGLPEPSDQLFGLRVDADHRVTGGQERLSEGVDVAELGVPVGVLSAFEGLAGRLQAVPGRAQQIRHRGVADGVPHRGQLGRQVPRRFRRPPQRRLRIPPRRWLDQRIHTAQQFRVGAIGFLATTPGRPNTTVRPFFGIAIQLGEPATNRRPRRAGGPMHRGDPTTPPRPRFRRQRQTPITFIQPRQQNRQPTRHRSESVILVAHNPSLVGDTIRPERHAALYKHSLERISYYFTLPMRWFAAADCTLTWCVAIARIRRCDSSGSPLTS